MPRDTHSELDLWLVPHVEPDRQVRRLIDHVERQGFHVVRGSPDAAVRGRFPRIARVTTRGSGYPATRTPFDHPVARRLAGALERAFSEPPVRMPTMGGSVPAVWFPVVTGTQALLLPLVNSDNHQHAENENLRLGNLFQGVEILAAVLRM